jgi:hypothetical protein
MTNRIALIVAALSIMFWAAPVASQEPQDSVQEVRLIDGSTLYGYVTDGDPVHIRLLSGDEITVARSRIRSIERARGAIRDGEVWPEDPNLTRLFFSPTARTMEKGHGYIAAYELVFPFVAYAVTDNLLIAGGTPLFGDFDNDRVLYFAPKLRLYSKGRTDLAVGAFMFGEVGHSDFKAGAFYGALTQGTPDKAVTLVVGAGYDDDGLLDEPVVVLGGEYRVSRTIKLITENYFTSEGSLITLGPRFFGDRLSADLGIGLAMWDGEVFTLPIVNFVYVW